MSRTPLLQSLTRAAATPATWAVGIALVAVMIVLSSAEVDGASPARLGLFSVLPMLVLAVAITTLAMDQRWVALGALALAVSPTVFTATAASLLPGAVTVLVACGVVLMVSPSWRPSRAVLRVAAAGIVVAIPAAWFVARSRRVEGAVPLPEAVGTTGHSLRTVIGVVGRSGEPLPTTGLLLWCLAVGLLLGVTLLLGRRRDVLVIPVAFAAICGASMFIVTWRGLFDGRYLAWLLAAAVGYTGAVAVVPKRVDRRFGVAVGGLAVITWISGIVHVLRLGDPAPSTVALRITITLALLAVGIAGAAATGHRRAR